MNRISTGKHDGFKGLFHQSWENQSKRMVWCDLSETRICLVNTKFDCCIYTFIWKYAAISTLSTAHIAMVKLLLAFFFSHIVFGIHPNKLEFYSNNEQIVYEMKISKYEIWNGDFEFSLSHFLFLSFCVLLCFCIFRSILSWINYSAGEIRPKHVHGNCHEKLKYCLEVYKNCS